MTSSFHPDFRSHRLRPKLAHSCLLSGIGIGEGPQKVTYFGDCVDAQVNAAPIKPKAKMTATRTRMLAMDMIEIP
jgi:hypothetical protein